MKVIKIETVKIQVGKLDLELSIAEAKQLRDELLALMPVPPVERVTIKEVYRDRSPYLWPRWVESPMYGPGRLGETISFDCICTNSRDEAASALKRMLAGESL